LSARLDILGAFDADRYPPGHLIHVRACASGWRRLTDELRRQLVYQLDHRQAKANAGELGEQVSPGSGHGTNCGDRRILAIRVRAW